MSLRRSALKERRASKAVNMTSRRTDTHTHLLKLRGAARRRSRWRLVNTEATRCNKRRAADARYISLGMQIRDNYGTALAPVSSCRNTNTCEPGRRAAEIELCLKSCRRPALAGWTYRVSVPDTTASESVDTINVVHMVHQPKKMKTNIRKNKNTRKS